MIIRPVVWNRQGRRQRPGARKPVERTAAQRDDRWRRADLVADFHVGFATFEKTNASCDNFVTDVDVVTASNTRNA